MIDSIIAILSFLLKFINFKQPKIRVRFENNGTVYHAVQNGYSQIQWCGLLVLTNISKFPAFNIIINENSIQNPFKNIRIDYVELLPHKSFEVRTSVSKQVTLIERNNIRTDPDYSVLEFENFSVIYQYENENGKNYYTKFKKDGELEKCKYLLFKPKL